MAGSTACPTSAMSVPFARCAATGAKRSRPWNVDDTSSRHRRRLVSSWTAMMPPSRSAAGRSSPLSGPTNRSPRAARMAIGRRTVPTPGSTTARWTPTGRYGTDDQSRNAASRTAKARAVWVRSLMRASGQIDQITPRHVAGAVSSPKSVRKLRCGGATRQLRTMRTGRSGSMPRRPARCPWLSAIATLPSEST